MENAGRILLFFLFAICVCAMSACTDDGGKELVFSYAQDEAGNLRGTQDEAAGLQDTQDKAGEYTESSPQEMPQPEEAESQSVQQTSQAETIAVYICGEVVVPGVYMFEEGARLYQAVDAAGGFTDAAASDSINLARVLSDGEQITVYDKDAAQTICVSDVSGVSGYTDEVLGKAADNGSATVSGDTVNINEAGLAELITLPGIGETKAQAIIDYRNSFGPFTSIDDIKNVPGIKDGAFEKIKSLIRV